MTASGASQLSAMAAALVTDAFPSELLILSLKEIWGAGAANACYAPLAGFPVQEWLPRRGKLSAPQALEIFYNHLVSSLVGFQFGFLGAYIYFLTSLSRAYFLLDLTPGTMIEGSIRMAVASVVSLVLSFLLSSGAEAAKITEVMPVLSFFFGFFPKRAMAFLEQSVLKIVKTLSITSYQAIPLSVLHGMTYNHELRLEREGFGDVENLRHRESHRLGCPYRDQLWPAPTLDQRSMARRAPAGRLLRICHSYGDFEPSKKLEDLFALRAGHPMADLIPANER